MVFLEFMVEVDVWYYLVVKNIIYNRIRYLIGVKSGITYVVSYNYTRITVDSFDSLPLEKTLTFHNVLILIRSSFNKAKNNYNYNIFLEKYSYK